MISMFKNNLRIVIYVDAISFISSFIIYVIKFCSVCKQKLYKKSLHNVNIYKGFTTRANIIINIS